MTLNELPEEQGGVLAELAVVGAEGGEKVGVDIEFASDLAADKDRDDDFGFGFERAGEIAGIGIDVVNDDGFAGGSRSAADPLIEGDAGVRRHRALEWAKNEDVVIALFFKHVKADPVVASELFMEEGDDALHESVGGGGRFCESVESGNEIGRFGMCGGHGK